MKEGGKKGEIFTERRRGKGGKEGLSWRREGGKDEGGTFMEEEWRDLREERRGGIFMEEGGKERGRGGEGREGKVREG